MPEITIQAQGIHPEPHWAVIYDDCITIGVITQVGLHAFVIASFPARAFWTCQPTLALASRWCLDNALDVMDGGSLDSEEAYRGSDRRLRPLW